MAREVATVTTMVVTAVMRAKVRVAAAVVKEESVRGLR
jgi:hypothetical protein